LSEEKGVGDCLEAAARLDGVHFSFAGPGNLDQWRNRANPSHGLKQFLGVLSNDRVRQLMRESDIVVVPSRSSYAESMPNVIYEALSARTPLIISDHPACKGLLRDGEECLVFQGANPADLAAKISMLLNDTALYGRLSHNSAAAHRNLHFGTEWSALVRLFISDPVNESGWAEKNSLASLLKAPQQQGQIVLGVRHRRPLSHS